MTNKILLTESVNILLTKSDVPARLTIEQCASALAMSMTSFRRKLTLEETTFKLIQQKYLNELCVKALLTQHESIDILVAKLGYSERSTFERAFRNKFGITPSQFRELSLVDDTGNTDKQKLSDIAQNMPPLSDSCQQLLIDKDHASFDLQRVLEIVAQDPIFTGRLMGLASKAIYGKTPLNIQEAISRSLGINTVVNLAVVFSVKDALSAHVDDKVISQCTQAFLTAPKLFQLIRKSVAAKLKFDNALTEQVLVFGLLGILLLCHKDFSKHQFMLHSMQGVDEVDSLNTHVYAAMHISIYAASSLMLSIWHIDAKVIKQLHHIDKVSKREVTGTKQDELTLFMLSCLYSLISECNDYSHLEQKAELLEIENFAEIKAIFFNHH
ncbi:helix-turn-helix domain-containing protein [Colwellia echini]|uniref:HDOD domain-containing protein n=1 Tax=Colwellia echini TaxID=1982103 RepID=A0ABY3MWG2_9GAMM|nr:helix-turn-helix domain-containing protein [Colwellia echini]TYK65553.1 HDOD domain-containing protein [Colwellia echini]